MSDNTDPVPASSAVQKAIDEHWTEGSFFNLLCDLRLDGASTLSLHENGDDVHLRIAHHGRPDYNVAVLDQWGQKRLGEALLANGEPELSPDVKIGHDVIVHFAGRPIAGVSLPVQVGWEGDQFVELPAAFAVPAPAVVEPQVPVCKGMEGATGIDCQLDAGHPEDHEGTREPKGENDSIGYRLTVRWPRNEFDSERVAPAVVPEPTATTPTGSHTATDGGPCNCLCDPIDECPCAAVKA
jgi:hypothetical protein